MIKFVFILILVILQCEVMAATREWTSINGNKVNAELLDIQDGTIRLKTDDSRVIEIDRVMLSIGDRKYVDRYLSDLDRKLTKVVQANAVHPVNPDSDNENGVLQSPSESEFKKRLVYPCSEGDANIDAGAYELLDIVSVKATQTQENTVVFEIETKGDPRIHTEDSPYFLLAVNADGKATGSTTWVLGQEFAVRVYIPSGEKEIRYDQYGDSRISISNVEIAGHRLSLELSPFDSDRITFKAYTLIKRLSVDRRVPYMVIDRSTKYSHLFDFIR